MDITLSQSLKKYVEFLLIHFHTMEIERNLILPIIQI